MGLSRLGFIVTPDQFRRRRIGLESCYLLSNAEVGIDLKDRCASFSSDASSSHAPGLARRGKRRPSCFQTRIDGFDFLFEPWPSSFYPSFATSIEPFNI
jgi:hypothetical protein